MSFAKCYGRGMFWNEAIVDFEFITNTMARGNRLQCSTYANISKASFYWHKDAWSTAIFPLFATVLLISNRKTSIKMVSTFYIDSGTSKLYYSFALIKIQKQLFAIEWRRSRTKLLPKLRPLPTIYHNTWDLKFSTKRVKDK